MSHIGTSGFDLLELLKIVEFFLFVIPLVTFGMLVYFLPSLIAFGKKHEQRKAILILNIFLGLTFVGWVVALIWSVLRGRLKKLNLK